MPRFGSLARFRMAQGPASLASCAGVRSGGWRPPRCHAASAARRAAPARWWAGAACSWRRLPTCGAQAALHERFGPVGRPDAGVGASYRHARGLARQAVSLARELIDCARGHQLELPVDSEAICTRLLRTARLVGYWEALLASEAPRVAVVGSLTAPRARALILAAERMAIPTVYIPHTAQVSQNVALSAMPVDYAGLRGAQEVAYLRGQGVDAGRLDVVGNPTIAPQAPPDIDPARAPVFAAGLDDPSRLGPLVEVIEAALGDRVTVGRHPAVDPEAMRRAVPSAWTLFDGRTYDLLRSGPPVVLQHSSGVALEALHLGIPVIELCYPGQAGLYPLIARPHVRFASDSRELAAAAAAARADAREPASRDALIDWARSWASPPGAQAGERAVALVERALAEGPRGRIWDPAGAGR